MYSTIEVAEALAITPKRLDNILTGPGRQLVPRGVNGRSRTIQLETVEALAIALLLARDLGVSVSRAIALVRKLTTGPADGISIGRLASLRFDIVRLRSVLQNALGDVLEDRSQPRRGRPPGGTKRKRGTSL